MRTFLWVILVMMAIDATGKAVMIWKRDFIRQPSHMIGDIVIAIATLAWAAWLLGHEA